MECMFTELLNNKDLGLPKFIKAIFETSNIDE